MTLYKPLLRPTAAPRVNSAIDNTYASRQHRSWLRRGPFDTNCFLYEDPGSLRTLPSRSDSATNPSAAARRSASRPRPERACKKTTGTTHRSLKLVRFFHFFSWKAIFKWFFGYFGGPQRPTMYARSIHMDLGLNIYWWPTTLKQKIIVFSIFCMFKQVYILQKITFFFIWAV